MLFPGEKKASPTRAGRTAHSINNLNGLTAGTSALTTEFMGLTGQVRLARWPAGACPENEAAVLRLLLPRHMPAAMRRRLWEPNGHAPPWPAALCRRPQGPAIYPYLGSPMTRGSRPARRP